MIRSRPGRKAPCTWVCNRSSEDGLFLFHRLSVADKGTANRYKEANASVSRSIP